MREDDIINLDGNYAWADDNGASLPIVCKGCGQQLTVVKLNDKCVIDITVECSKCGSICNGKDLRTERVLNNTKCNHSNVLSIEGTENYMCQCCGAVVRDPGV